MSVRGKQTKLSTWHILLLLGASLRPAGQGMESNGAVQGTKTTSEEH